MLTARSTITSKRNSGSVVTKTTPGAYSDWSATAPGGPVAVVEPENMSPMSSHISSVMAASISGSGAVRTWSRGPSAAETSTSNTNASDVPPNTASSEEDGWGTPSTTSTGTSMTIVPSVSTTEANSMAPRRSSSAVKNSEKGTSTVSNSSWNPAPRP